MRCCSMISIVEVHGWGDKNISGPTNAIFVSLKAANIICFKHFLIQINCIVISVRLYTRTCIGKTKNRCKWINAF